MHLFYVVGCSFVKFVVGIIYERLYRSFFKINSFLCLDNVSSVCNVYVSTNFDTYCFLFMKKYYGMNRATCLKKLRELLKRDDLRIEKIERKVCRGREHFYESIYINEYQLFFGDLQAEYQNKTDFSYVKSSTVLGLFDYCKKNKRYIKPEILF